MYDTDEEIRRKRRNLFIVIGIIVLLILLIVLFLLTRNIGKKNNNKDDVNTEITCSLEIQGGMVADSSGVYHEPVTVGFKNITAISKDYQITKKAIGTSDNSRNKETFTATKSGKYHLYGYVQDSVGHKGKCEISLQIDLTSPACSLEVTKGTLGDNGWYRSDVEVGFSSMDANNSTLSIVKYYIEKEVTSLDSGETVKAEQPTSNIEKYTVKDNQVTTLVGHIIDSAGNEGTCNITIKKDSTVPKCTLKVLSGTKNANGEYTDNPVIGIDETKDDVSEIAGKGIGTSKNYTKESFTVTDEGKTTVVGYVKDKAGNEGTCSLEITRPTTTVNPTPTSTATPTPKKNSQPYCKIYANIPQSDYGTNVYSQPTTFTLETGTTNGATVVDYGLSANGTYNKLKSTTISNNGTYSLTGVVKDSYGNVANCYTGSFTIDIGYYLYERVGAGIVKIGDYVNYDAGTWDVTRTEQLSDGYYWGMKSGTSRNTGVSCKSGEGKSKSGWRVYNVVNNQVYLIHAGTPECIYHSRSDSSRVQSTARSEAAKYVNTKYAYASTIISCNLAGFSCDWNKFVNDIYLTGTHYWILQPAADSKLYAVTPQGNKEPFNEISLGLRPIVILREDVKITGQKDSNGAWILK